MNTQIGIIQVHKPLPRLDGQSQYIILPGRWPMEWDFEDRYIEINARIGWIQRSLAQGLVIAVPAHDIALADIFFYKHNKYSTQDFEYLLDAAVCRSDWSYQRHIIEGETYEYHEAVLRRAR